MAVVLAATAQGAAAQARPFSSATVQVSVTVLPLPRADVVRDSLGRLALAPRPMGGADALLLERTALRVERRLGGTAPTDPARTVVVRPAAVSAAGPRAEAEIAYD
ncbi:MAG: hypothetical protein NW201_09720 [Gemmatimonadales bacterium]|nr:hypothetical protein [Gemmatimonadales bacterium]